MSRHRFTRMTLASVGSKSFFSLPEATRISAQKFGVTVSDIMGQRRTWPIAHARQEAMRLAHATDAYTLVQIGRFFGRDHSTVLHGIKAATDRKT